MLTVSRVGAKPKSASKTGIFPKKEAKWAKHEWLTVRQLQASSSSPLLINLIPGRGGGKIFFAMSGKVRNFASDFRRKSRSVILRTCEWEPRKLPVCNASEYNGLRVMRGLLWLHLHYKVIPRTSIRKTWYTVPRFYFYYLSL